VMLQGWLLHGGGKTTKVAEIECSETESVSLQSKYMQLPIRPFSFKPADCTEVFAENEV
jgi:hypothetical protein